MITLISSSNCKKVCSGNCTCYTCPGGVGNWEFSSHERLEGEFDQIGWCATFCCLMVLGASGDLGQNDIMLTTNDYGFEYNGERRMCRDYYVPRMAMEAARVSIP